MNMPHILITVCTFFWFATPLHATNIGPQTVVESAASALFLQLNENKDKFKKNPDLLRVVIKRDLMPKVDHTYAAYKVLGPTLKETTAEQRQRFVSAFENHITLTYTDLLAEYEDETYRIERTILSDTGNLARVSLLVHDQRKKDVKLEFLLRKNKANQWLIYDMITENISLLNTKQAEFSSILRDSKRGIDYLNKQLENDYQERLSKVSK